MSFCDQLEGTDGCLQARLIETRNGKKCNKEKERGRLKWE